MLGKTRFAGYLMVGFVGLALTAEAVRLEPALRARDVSGSVAVQRPGRSEFEPVEEGIAYAYGSRFRSAAESAVTLAMGEGNAVRVLAGTEIVFTEGSQNANVKTVRLLSGEVEATLSQDFAASGAVLNIEAANAVTQAIGTRYRVASRYEQDLQIVIVRVLAGVVRVLGENFEVAELGADQWLSLLSPPDASFLRLKSMRGEFEVTIKDEDKGDRRLAAEEGSVLKIWQRIVPETGERVITAVFSDPEGLMLEQVTVTYGPDEFADFVADIRDSDDEFPWDQLDRPARTRDEDDDGDNPMPPDAFMDELVQRSLEGLAPGAGRTPRLPRPQPPRPPQRPTPTPVGNQ